MIRKLALYDPNPSDLAMIRLKIYWRVEPVYVARYWDELWLGVKVQSNLV